ncbi:MAG: DUF2996 domain-containing protein [Pseudanabaenaceae cyanobacterium bins.68]|nr:DUF2996 domain-containing protein [Pseudanabaenaceae cyanobacterium bins.68]
MSETAPSPKPASKPKAEKPPALEDLPFHEFISQHYLPALHQAFAKNGVTDLILDFQSDRIQGKWQNQLCQFVLYFAKPDINSQKAFACADWGKTPSNIEPFLIDERKATLDLMVFGVIQRLTAQKWLSRN